ncbi:VWFA domain-containing protein [Tenacibaculum sp. 190524A02b]|uniref:VWFA domain-containing protein n=1 Tax=Tenacibaculum vairaonense TaxID=3137860 RepID=A0ABP1F5B6_9FLAO
MKTHTIYFLLASLFIGTVNATDAEKISKPMIKVALLLDTSNSMDGLINQAKAQLWEIVNELSYAKCKGESPNLEIALYEYGNDDLAIKKGFIRKVLAFTNDLDAISERLFSLDTNGGKEYCGEVIQTSIDELEWGKQNDDLKMIFIAGNEPFTQGKTHFKDAIIDAKEKGITVNTIFCGDYNQGISGSWQEGAHLGEGDYMTINHNKKIVHVVTPYDKDIIILNKKLNKTYLYYGNKGASKYSNQAKQDANATVLDEVVAVKRAVTKSSKMYSNASWDLVDASKDKKFDYKKLKKKQLPKTLQNKSEKEIEVYVEKKRKEREVIQQKIQYLNTKRKRYALKKQNENSKNNELNRVMINAIKKQAKKKNYSW